MSERNGESSHEDNAGKALPKVGTPYPGDRADVAYARSMDWADEEGNWTEAGLEELKNQKSQDSHSVKKEVPNVPANKPGGGKKKEHHAAPNQARSARPKKPVADGPEAANIDKPNFRIFTLLKSLGYDGKYLLEEKGSEFQLTLYGGKKEYPPFRAEISALEEKLKNLFKGGKPTATPEAPSLKVGTPYPGDRADVSFARSMGWADDEGNLTEEGAKEEAKKHPQR